MRSIPLSLVLTLVLAVQAAAGVRVAAPGAAKTMGAIIERTLPGLQAAGLPGTESLQALLGEVRFDLALKREEGAAFLAGAMPGIDSVDAEAFDKLPLSAQARILNDSIANLQSQLGPEAETLLARQASGRLTEADRGTLLLFGRASYLLPDSVRARVKAAAVELGEKEIEEASHGILGGLLPAKSPADAAVEREIKSLFAGAESLMRAGHKADGPRGAFARASLAPYANRAMEQAEARLRERGIDADALHLTILVNHQGVFAETAPHSLIAPLRRTGDWTDFVSHLSYIAGGRLDPATYSQSLAPLSARREFFMKMPSWNILGLQHETVADWLAHRFGKAEPAPLIKPDTHVATIFGIPVGFEKGFAYFYLLMAFILGGGFAAGLPALSAGAMLAGLLYLSIIAHEFGHALAARAFGIRTLGITLGGFGGAAHLEKEPRKASHDFWITAAGPLVNFAIAGAIFLLFPGNPLLAKVMIINLALGVLNVVIPAFPMDSSHLIRSGLTMALGDDYKAGRITTFLSRLAAPAVLLIGIWQLAPFTILAGLYLVQATDKALKPGTELVDRP